MFSAIFAALLGLSLLAPASAFASHWDEDEDDDLFEIDTGYGLVIKVSDINDRNCRVAGKTFKGKDEDGDYRTDGLFYRTGYDVAVFVFNGQELNWVVLPCDAE